MPSYKGKEKVIDEEKDEYDDGEEEEDENDSMDGEQSDEEEKDAGYWRDIIANTCKDIEFEKPEDLLREPLLSHVVDEMRKLVEKRLSFTAYMENNDDVYERISREENRLAAFDEDDAQETAWHNKRFLIKRVLADNLDMFEKEEEEEDDENIDEDEEEDEDIDVEKFHQYPPHYL